MIKVMTFNIRYGSANDAGNHWDHRKALALSRVHAFEPDLLGLQECRDDAQAQFVKTNLPAYEFHGLRRGGYGDGALEMAPLLFRPAAFQMLQTGYFWLSDTPHTPGSISWGSAFARTVTWAKLLHKPTARTVTFVNTHFDYQPSAIDASARCLRRWLDDIQKESPVILTGDFNANKHALAYKTLIGNGQLSDAYRQAHPKPTDEATFHGFGTHSPLLPIDWILVSNHFYATSASVDRTRQGHLFPSDHDPVLVVLEWKTTTPPSQSS